MKRLSVIICCLSITLVFISIKNLFAFQQDTTASGISKINNSFLLKGTYDFQTAEYDWYDSTRNREVPVKIYMPKDSAGSFPVIIFSHGLGGSREGYKYLGEYWASHGFISIHPTHIGSDRSVYRHSLHPLMALARAAEDPTSSVNRFKDISFVIDKLDELNITDSLLKGRINLDEIGVGGHSFGGYTVLGCAGMKIILQDDSQATFTDKRIKAAIAMSPPAGELPDSVLNVIYGGIKIPFFVMTGTKDNSPFMVFSKFTKHKGPLGLTTAEDRRIPFDHMNGTDDYLLILNGGDHMVFSGRFINTPSTRKNDPVFHKLILYSSTAFWDAYLKHNSFAKEWLVNGGFKSILGPEGIFEYK